MVIAALNQLKTNMFNLVDHKMYTAYCRRMMHTSKASVRTTDSSEVRVISPMKCVICCMPVNESVVQTTAQTVMRALLQ